MQRGQSNLGDVPMGSSRGCGRAQIVEKSTCMWLGKPPQWVEMFKISNSLLLQVFSDMYTKSGRSCNLSSVLQSLYSWYPLNFDWIAEGRDEALSSLCELIMQYIDLKIESDIEELYVCFRLLKRYHDFFATLVPVVHFYLYSFTCTLAHIIQAPHSPQKAYFSFILLVLRHLFSFFRESLYVATT